MPAPALHNPRYRREEIDIEALDGCRDLGYIVITMNDATRTAFAALLKTMTSAERVAFLNMRVLARSIPKGTP